MIFIKHEAQCDEDNIDQIEGGRRENCSCLFPFLTLLNLCKVSKVLSPFKEGREGQGQ